MPAVHAKRKGFPQNLRLADTLRKEKGIARPIIGILSETKKQKVVKRKREGE